MNKRLTYKRKTYKKTEIAYLAGLIDGEGSIYIGAHSFNPKTKAPYYQTYILITSTDKVLIDWLENVFGGMTSQYTAAQTAKNARRTAYRWVISGERLTHLCKLILPYLVIKQREAEIMLKMRATYTLGATKGNQGVKDLTPKILELRCNLKDELRSIHNR